MSTDLYINDAAENVYEYDVSAPKSSQKNDKEFDNEKSEPTSKVQSLTLKLVCLLTVLNIAFIIVIPALYFQSEAKWKGALQQEIQKVVNSQNEYETAQKSVVARLNGTDDRFQEAIANIETKMKNDTAASEERFYRLEETTNHISSAAIRDCSAADPRGSKVGNQSYGVFEIYVKDLKVDVFCDFITEKKKWTVIQRRMDGSVDFYRNYSEYIRGFGNKSGEFWIGLENMHNILQTSYRYELRIDMEDWDGVKRFAKYSRFYVAEADKHYSLTVTGYSGTAGDSLSRHSGEKFSTKDNDLDLDGSPSTICALKYKGAWWYENCHSSNLNGLYHKNGNHKSYADGVNWQAWKGYYYSLKFVEMKISPTHG